MIEAWFVIHQRMMEMRASLRSRSPVAAIGPMQHRLERNRRKSAISLLALAFRDGRGYDVSKRW
jgi:hypothetical protein